jgi:FixJ family two-component response regulator
MQIWLKWNQCPWPGVITLSSMTLRAILQSKRNLVFVVDDDPAMLRAVGRLLRQFDYDTLLFPSAEAFADHRDFANAACVLLDINLGDVSGIDIRHRLKAANVAVPVIYMTGNDGPAIRDAAIKSDCAAYLTKPFPAASLIEAINVATGESGQANRPMPAAR